MKHNETKRTNSGIQMLTTKEVMKALKISRTTLYRYMQKGELPAYKFGGKDLKFKLSDVEAFIEAHRKK